MNLDHQSRVAGYITETLADYLRAWPDATLEEVLLGLDDAKTDAPFVYQATLGEHGVAGAEWVNAEAVRAAGMTPTQIAIAMPVDLMPGEDA